MVLLSNKLSTITEEKDALVNDINNMRTGIISIAKKFPVGEYDPYIEEILKIAKCSEQEAGEVSEVRSIMAE